MTVHVLHRHSGTTAPTVPDVNRRRAWVSLALLPVAILLAALVGDGLLSLAGYESGSPDSVPLGPASAAAVPAMLVMLASPVAAVYFGHRARRSSDPTRLEPATVGVFVFLLLVTVNVSAFVVGR